MAQTAEAPLVYTRKEAAARAKIGVSTLDELIARGIVPVSKNKHTARVLIPAGEFDKWVLGENAE